MNDEQFSGYRGLLVTASPAFRPPTGARRPGPTNRDALARMLLAPFRAGPPHIVQLGPVWIPQPAPSPSDRVQGARRPMGRKQHSRDIRI